MCPAIWEFLFLSSANHLRLLFIKTVNLTPFSVALLNISLNVIKQNYLVSSKWRKFCIQGPLTLGELKEKIEKYFCIRVLMMSTGIHMIYS